MDNTTRETETDITCDVCEETLSRRAIALDWPVPTERGNVCPGCYGDEAFCPEGHILSGVDEDPCAICAAIGRVAS